MSPRVDVSRLSAGLFEVVASGVPRKTAQHLADDIRNAADTELFRVDPLRFGRKHDLDPDEAVDLFIYATVAGLFQMEWNIVCAFCGNVFKSSRTLEKLDPHFHCTLCDVQNRARLDDIIQVTFTVDQGVRRVVFHDPSELSVDQLLFDYHYRQSVRPSSAGGESVDYLREATVVLQYLEPGESTEVDLELLEGWLLIRDWATSFAFFVSPDEDPAEWSYRLGIGDAGLGHEGISTSAMSIETPVGTLALPAVHSVGPGPIRLSVANEAVDRRPLWVVEYPQFPVADVLGTGDSSGSLTAKQLLDSATFGRSR